LLRHSGASYIDRSCGTDGMVRLHLAMGIGKGASDIRQSHGAEGRRRSTITMDRDASKSFVRADAFFLEFFIEYSPLVIR
jgi:hypothetical protein